MSDSKPSYGGWEKLKQPLKFTNTPPGADCEMYGLRQLSESQCKSNVSLVRNVRLGNSGSWSYHQPGCILEAGGNSNMYWNRSTNPS